MGGPVVRTVGLNVRAVGLKARVAVASPALICALALAGCGLGPSLGATAGSRAPSGSSTATSSRAERPARSSAAGVPAADASAATAPAAVARADRTHELPTPAPRQTVIGGWRSPVQAVEVFADTYINWTAATVSERLQALAEVSVGQARSAMRLAAGETAHDYELRRGGIANEGVVEAIAPVRGSADRYAVVTRERTTASNTSAYRGLEPAWHVSLATVTRIRGGLWVLSAWQPEN